MKRIARVALATAVAIFAVNNEILPVAHLDHGEALMADYTVWGDYGVTVGYQRIVWRPGCTWAAETNDDDDAHGGAAFAVMPVACRTCRALTVVIRITGVAIGAAAAVPPQWPAVIAAAAAAVSLAALAITHATIVATLQLPVVVAGTISMWIAAVAATVCAVLMRPPRAGPEAQPLIPVAE
jgi:hypothetical protein